MAGLRFCTLSAPVIGSVTHPVRVTSLLIPSIKKEPSPSLRAGLNPQRFWLKFLRARVMDVTTATRSMRSIMSTKTSDTDKAPEASARQAKRRRTAAKKPKPTKKAHQQRKAADKPQAEQGKKKAEGI